MVDLNLTTGVCIALLASMAVFIIHCNIWYYSKTPEEREEMDKDLDQW